MKQKKKNYKIGDMVSIEGMTSFVTDTERRITGIWTKYNTETGKPYQIIDCNGWQFDSRTGEAINSPTMYFIDV